jgi:hypothetical protein
MILRIGGHGGPQFATCFTALAPFEAELASNLTHVSNHLRPRSGDSPNLGQSSYLRNDLLRLSRSVDFDSSPDLVGQMGSLKYHNQNILSPFQYMETSSTPHNTRRQLHSGARATAAGQIRGINLRQSLSLESVGRSPESGGAPHFSMSAF